MKSENEFNYSVIIPMFNNVFQASRAIASVLNQSILPKEIILVDDGSSQDSGYLLKSFPIKYIKLEHNSGSYIARKIGILSSNTEYVFLLDSDDVWSNNHTKKHFDIWRRYKYKEITMVGTLLAPQRNMTQTLPYAKKNTNLSRKGERKIKMLELLKSNPFYNSATSFRTKNIQNYLKNDKMIEKITYCEDMYVQAMLLLDSKYLLLSPETTGIYSLSENRKSKHHAEIYLAHKFIIRCLSNIQIKSFQQVNLIWSIYLAKFLFGIRWLYMVQSDVQDFAKFKEIFGEIINLTNKKEWITKFDNKTIFYLLKTISQIKKANFLKLGGH